jgi:hypothetical protein
MRTYILNPNGKPEGKFSFQRVGSRFNGRRLSWKFNHLNSHSKRQGDKRTEILGMLAAGRTGADIARIFRVHRATISRIVAGARTIANDATSPAQGHPSESVPEQNDRRSRRRTPPKS